MGEELVSAPGSLLKVATANPTADLHQLHKLWIESVDDLLLELLPLMG
jgi:hypothetical protein